MVARSSDRAAKLVEEANDCAKHGLQIPDPEIFGGTSRNHREFVLAEIWDLTPDTIYVVIAVAAARVCEDKSPITPARMIMKMGKT